MGVRLNECIGRGQNANVTSDWPARGRTSGVQYGSGKEERSHPDGRDPSIYRPPDHRGGVLATPRTRRRVSLDGRHCQLPNRFRPYPNVWRRLDAWCCGPGRDGEGGGQRGGISRPRAGRERPARCDVNAARTSRPCSLAPRRRILAWTSATDPGHRARPRSKAAAGSEHRIRRVALRHAVATSAARWAGELAPCPEGEGTGAIAGALGNSGFYCDAHAHCEGRKTKEQREQSRPAPETIGE